MQRLEERNTFIPSDAPQVSCNYGPVLNRDLMNERKVRSDLSVLGLKTSSNSPKWTNPAREKQNLRVSAKSKSTNKSNKPTKSKSNKSDSIQDFNKYTKGMSFSDKQKYLMMSEEERAKIRQNVQEKEKTENEKIEKLLKEKEIKIIKQVSVMVLNMRGEPLDPCSPAKAKKLLKQNKAKVVQRCPFTIQLKSPTGEARQPLKLGLDPGYKTVGFSIINKKREVLSGEVTLRTDIPERLIEKSMYRRGRRNRNTGYREPRWKNRGNKEGKKKGWLPPSIQHKLGTYVRLVKRFSNILPVSNINVEISPFDTQKMQNPEISGIEYQQGTLQGYHVKEYLLEKWGRKCSYKGETNVPLETEHIIPTSRGGTNRISNLTIACHKCNQDKDNKTAAEFGYPNIQLQAKQSLKAVPFMNIVRSQLIDILKKEFPNIYIDSTYGYITKYNRKQLGLEKTHYNDAFVIAGGQNQTRSKPYTVKQIRRNDRSLQLNRKGQPPSIKRHRYEFKPGDLIKRRSLLTTTGWGEKRDKKDRSQVFTVKGIFNLGKWIRLENPIQGEKDINIKTDDAKILKYGSGLLFQYKKIQLIEKKYKIDIPTKKEQKELDMKGQKSIDDAWN
jgi:5-methylcytosine-specific restriction endonuclease McrA